MYEELGSETTPESGWARIAALDGAASVVDAVLRLDPESEYTKTELSEAAGVALKTLYLDGTLDAIVDIGLLERHDAEDEETTFSVAADSEVYDAATAFDDAVLKEAQTAD